MRLEVGARNLLGEECDRSAATNREIALRHRRSRFSALPSVCPSVMHVFLLDQPEVTLTKAELDKLGVLSWVIPVETVEQDGILDGICRERKYTYKDIVRSSSSQHL